MRIRLECNADQSVNAVRQFFGAGGQEKQQSGGIDGLLGKAMSMAGQSAGKSGGSQENAMNHAGGTVMKVRDARATYTARHETQNEEYAGRWLGL